MPKQTFFNLDEEKRCKIIEIAVEEFAQNDYEAGSISRIVSKAGIAKGSFYQYFAGKKDLYLYLLELVSQQKGMFLQKNPPPESEMGTFAYLRWLFEMGVQFEFEQPQLASVAYRAFYGNNPFVKELVAQVQSASNGFLESLIQQGIAHGDLRDDLDMASAVFLFGTVFAELGNHILQRLGIPPQALEKEGLQIFETEEAQAIFNNIMDVLENGMRG